MKGITNFWGGKKDEALTEDKAVEKVAEAVDVSVPGAEKLAKMGAILRHLPDKPESFTNEDIRVVCKAFNYEVIPGKDFARARLATHISGFKQPEKQVFQKGVLSASELPVLDEAAIRAGMEAEVRAQKPVEVVCPNDVLSDEERRKVMAYGLVVFKKEKRILSEFSALDSQLNELSLKKKILEDDFCKRKQALEVEEGRVSEALQKVQGEYEALQIEGGV